MTPVAKTAAEVVGQWTEIGANSREPEAFGRAMGKMAKDLGLSPVELRTLAAKGTGAKELPYLLDALRISVRALAKKEPLVLKELRRACTSCSHKRECNHDIADGTLVASYPTYCANVAVLKKLQLDGRFTTAGWTIER
jgi:hypothetical protein